VKEEGDLHVNGQNPSPDSYTNWLKSGGEAPAVPPVVAAPRRRHDKRRWYRRFGSTDRTVRKRPQGVPGKKKIRITPGKRHNWQALRSMRATQAIFRACRGQKKPKTSAQNKRRSCAGKSTDRARRNVKEEKLLCPRVFCEREKEANACPASQTTKAGTYAF